MGARSVEGGKAARLRSAGAGAGACSGSFGVLLCAPPTFPAPCNLHPLLPSTPLPCLAGLLALQAEQAAKSLHLPYTTIVRPGLLERGELARGLEKLSSKLLSSVAVSQVARVMLADAERWHEARGPAAAGAEPEVKVFEMGDLQNYA